jgi:hypothetical protein
MRHDELVNDLVSQDTAEISRGQESGTGDRVHKEIIETGETRRR